MMAAGKTANTGESCFSVANCLKIRWLPMKDWWRIEWTGYAVLRSLNEKLRRSCSSLLNSAATLHSSPRGN